MISCTSLPVNDSFCNVANYIIIDQDDVLTPSTKRQILKHDLNVKELCHKEININ